MKLTSEITLSNSGFLFDHETGMTYTLNETGQYIFRGLQDGKDMDEILQGMLDEFEINESTARNDLDDYFRQLKDLGIVE